MAIFDPANSRRVAAIIPPINRDESRRLEVMTMPNLLDEDLVPFAPGIRSLPGRPHISTGYRFITRGCRGVTLESVVVGGRRFTSHQALRRFVASVTAAANARPSKRSAGVVVDASLAERIERKLDDAGL
jgi:hypothetical protein